MGEKTNENVNTIKKSSMPEYLEKLTMCPI
jgi:hypothetical protein